MNKPLLEVVDLHLSYSTRSGELRAVDGISFEIHRGETLALVGESGCGKSSTAKLILRIKTPTAGSIYYEGQDIMRLSGAELKQVRRRLQMVFQDPYSSLNPRMTIEQTLLEPLIVHRIGDKVSRNTRVKELLKLVGLTSNHAARYPHEFSGGQRQRIGIARALAVGPSLVVCDEPVSALDVSVQAQIINLLRDLQDQLGLSYLFISHDLAVVKNVADRIAVMYRGRIVEIAPRDLLFSNPRHPYTRVLLSAVLRPEVPRQRDRNGRSLEILDNSQPAQGCRFSGRCAFAIEHCRNEEPSLLKVENAHFSACHRAHELPSQPVLEPILESPAAALRLGLYAMKATENVLQRKVE